MRIVIDLQGAQSESRFRGIGRYTISFAQAVVRNRGENEVLLALNGLFPDSIEPIRAAFEGLLPQENIRVWYAPGPLREGKSGNDSRRDTAELIREAFLASLQPDVIHISSLFEGFMDDAVTSIGRFDLCSLISVTLFDLIPLLNPDHYLRHSSSYSRYYLRKITWLNQAGCLLAISESAQQEGRANLSQSDACIVNVSTAIEPCFQPLDIEPADAVKFCHRLGISLPFILHTGGCDDRKNLSRLIKAFAALPLPLRSKYQLVLPGKMSAGVRFRLRQVANSVGLNSDQLLLIGFVDDIDLIWLYNLCALYVFPSWHEGFGLPALEAMACGAPVIAANTSSLPEVVNLPEALFDPFDIQAIAAKIQAGLVNESFRELLKENSQLQSRRFSWDATAERAFNAWRRIMPSRTKTAWAHPQEHHRLINGIAVSQFQRKNPDLVALAASIALNSQAGTRRQLLVDVSEISRNDANTGIQRVVRSYLKCLLACPPPGFRVEPVYSLLGKGYFYARNYTADVLGLPKDSESDPPMRWQRGDVFFGLDMQHDIQLSHQLFYQQLRSEGVVVKFMLYDLIPIQNPEFFYHKKLGKLHSRLLAMMAETDGVICISRSTADAFVEWTRRKRSSNTAIQVDWVHIGADFTELEPDSDPDQIQPAAEINLLTSIQSRLAFLCVATLEPRKGQQQVLDAMELLWQQECDYNLIFVGQHGWKTEELAARIESHPELGHRLFWLRGISDAFLEKIYSVSTVLLAASYNEGFGLPLIEAARHGLPIIARDIPVFREVAGCHAFFFSGDTPLDLATAITVWQRLYRIGQQPDSGKISWLTWQESTHKLCRIVLPQSGLQKQLLVDVSELIQRDAKSGIQRVVRSILSEWLANPPPGWRVIPVYATMNSSYRYAYRLAAQIQGLPHCHLKDQAIDCAPGDVFFGLDLAPSVIASKHQFLQFLRRQGVRTEFLVYDLLPLIPSYFEANHERAFSQWLSVVAECDGAICISQSVANDFGQWLQRARIQRLRSFNLRWFHLGADIDHASPSTGLPPNFSHVIELLRSRRTFLMVSTLAPHKGHAQVLEAFELLWREHNYDLNLVFVGKQGWRVNSLAKALRSHPESNRRLFWLEGISDECLGEIYSASTCYIAASYAEGFGLPLIESAQRHLPIMARDIPVFREVAGNHAYFFVADNPADLVAHIHNWLRLYDDDCHPKSLGLPWLSWQESAAKLLNLLVDHSTC